MKYLDLAKIHKSEAHRLIYEEIQKNNPKKILLAGGSTPMDLYSDVLKKLNCKFLVIDERISNDISKLNQQNIKKQYPAFMKIKFPSDKESINHFSEKLTSIYENFLPADLCILGMGEDGHYASIFPKHKKIFTCKKNLYFFSFISETSEIRFSLTKDSIAKSKKIILLINSDNQRKIEIINSLKENGDLNLPICRLFNECANKTTIITI